MTALDLIEQLQEAIEDGTIDMHSDVRYASQPRYPFENEIEDEIRIHNGKVYLAESHQIGYLPQPIRDELGW